MRLAQSMVNTESIYTHAGEPLSLINHETDHFRVCQIELGQVAEA